MQAISTRAVSDSACPSYGSGDPAAIQCMLGAVANSEFATTYTCSQNTDGIYRGWDCYRCKTGYIFDSAKFTCVAGTSTSTNQQTSAPVTITIPLQCPNPSSDNPRIVGCRSSNYLNYPAENANRVNVKAGYACANSLVCYECKTGYVRNANTDFCEPVSGGSTTTQQSGQTTDQGQSPSLIRRIFINIISFFRIG